MISRLKIKKRSALADHDFFHFGNEDSVVSGVLRALQSAFEVSQRTMQYGSAVLSAVKFCSDFLFGTSEIAVDQCVIL